MIICLQTGGEKAVLLNLDTLNLFVNVYRVCTVKAKQKSFHTQREVSLQVSCDTKPLL